MPVHEGHEPPRDHRDALARRRLPHHLAIQRAGPHVESALVLAYVGVLELEGLVVDVQLDDLGVGDVDDGLSGLGEAVGLLAVHDGPRLVEAVQ
jgi:hypothetical protein